MSAFSVADFCTEVNRAGDAGSNPARGIWNFSKRAKAGLYAKEKRSLGKMEKVEVPRRKIYRLLYPRQTVLVTCIDEKTKKPNILPIAWCTPLSFDPLLVGVSVAPQRYSHGLIAGSGEFVINLPTSEILSKAVRCGKISGRDRDKFSEVGLTPKPARALKVPVIEECIAHLECKLAEKIPIGDHTLFVGEVIAAYANEGAFTGEFLDLGKVRVPYQVGGDFFTTPSKELLKPKL